MRNIRSLFIIPVLLIVAGCQKATNQNTLPAKTENLTPVPPSAGFKIANEATMGAVWEAKALVFDNTSINAESYKWDFGDGTFSTEKTPTNISFAPCGEDRTIKLTVLNKSGQAATYSATYTVYCFRGIGGRH